MRSITLADGVENGLLEETEAGEMARLLAEAFSRFEPMGVAIEIPYDQIVRLVAAFVPKALTEQLTIVARHASEGHLVSALLAHDFGTVSPAGLEEAVPCFAPIGSLLDGLDQRYRVGNPVAPGTHAHLFMLGVAASVGSRGIAGRLVDICIANAARIGYRTAITEATGSASQHVFRKRDFTDRFVASYKEFTFNGQCVFSSIEGVEGTVLMTRELSEHLRTSDQGGAV